MKACSHIKDFRELFCEENSAHFVPSVIASFGHLQSKGKPGVHKGIFYLQTIGSTKGDCTHPVHIICAFLRGEDAI